MVTKQLTYLAEFKAQDDQMQALKIKQQEQRDELNILLIQLLLLKKENNYFDNDSINMINLR